MSLFNNLGSKITNVGNQVSSKVKDSGEQLKLGNEINGLKSQVLQHYQKLGEIYYAEHRDNSGPQDYDAECDLIDQLQDLITEKQKQIEALKSQITCPVCGKSVPADSAFCPNCGTPITQTAAAPAEESGREKRCPNCGAVLPEGAVFCTSCGTRVVAEGDDHNRQEQ